MTYPKRFALSLAFAVSVAAVGPAVFSWATKAEAATNISISINFYDELAPFGNWVSYQDRPVWIPQNVDAGWRPYTQGHWGYTRPHGWIWVSDEKFGWATYHYGRWGQAPGIGWYWVPGRRWAPAWVAWRFDDTHIAWAPLPPGSGDGMIGDIPDDFWQAVPVSAFVSPDDLSGRVYRDRDGARHGAPQTVRIVDNSVVNDVIKVDDIEKRTKKKVVALEEKAVDNPEAAGMADSNSVAIFIPELKDEPDAKPKETSTIAEVVKEREAKGIPDEEQSSGQAATTTDEPVTKPKKDQDVTEAGGDEKTKAVVEEAIEKGNDKLVEEADRVPGLKYDDISRISSKIPGKVQIPDPTSKDFSSRAISVPGGLVSNECKHFARGLIAKRLMIEDANLGQKAAMAKVIGHLKEQRVTYAKLVAGKEGLKRSDVAIHDATCPICGPLNAAEIACHKAAEKNSPIRELVKFDFASEKLSGGHAIATIQQIKTLLNQDPDLQVALIGRSSIPGGPVPNFALSTKRITSVWHGLDKASVPIDRIVAIPIGEDEPHIDLQTAIDYGLEGDFAAYGQEPLNQSVNIVVFRPEKQTASNAPDEELQGALPQGDTLESKRKLDTAKQQTAIDPSLDVKPSSQPQSGSEPTVGEMDVREAQKILIHLGYYSGTADGIVGPLTAAALERFLTAQGMAPSGTLNADLLTVLRVQGKPSG